MGSTIGFVILYAIAGPLLAAICRLVIDFAGLPGGWLGRALVPDEDWRGKGSVSGLVVSVLGQSYVALAFCAVLVAFNAKVLHGRNDLTGWILWLVLFFVSLLPSSVAMKDAAEKPRKRTPDVAIMFTFVISGVGFWIFVINPSLIHAGWGWITP